MARYHESAGRVRQLESSVVGADGLVDVKSVPSARLASLLARVGRKREARGMLGELRADADRSGIYSPVVASVLLALDDGEGALATRALVPAEAPGAPVHEPAA